MHRIHHICTAAADIQKSFLFACSKQGFGRWTASSTLRKQEWFFFRGLTTLPLISRLRATASPPPPLLTPQSSSSSHPASLLIRSRSEEGANRLFHPPFLSERKRKKKLKMPFFKLSFVQKCFREVEGALPIIHAFVDGSMNSFQVEKSPLLLFCTDAGYSARGPEEEGGQHPAVRHKGGS